MSKILVVKADHSIRITRTLESVPGSCGIVDPHLGPDGKITYDFDGSGTDVDWDGQETIGFLDEDGNTYGEDDLELIDEPDDDGDEDDE